MPRKRTNAELETERREARANADRLQELAEKALAKLPPSEREQRERAGSDAAWLRELAERAQTELDRQARRDA